MIGLRDKIKSFEIIDRIIKTHTKEYTGAEASRLLQHCGILDKKGNIRQAYKKIFIKTRETT